jgi:hypothetical protein
VYKGLPLFVSCMVLALRVMVDQGLGCLWVGGAKGGHTAAQLALQAE